MTRIVAREIAVITVYEMDYCDAREELIAERLDDAFYERMAGECELLREPPGTQAVYIRRVTEGVLAHMAELDEYIEKYARNWKFSRLPRMSVAVLRVALFEALYMTAEVPAAAAINAAVDIIKNYESPEIASFVNGVLGSFYREELAKMS